MDKNEQAKPSVSFPIKRPGHTKVWRVIESTLKGKTERTIKLSIQEIPEDRYEEVADFMCNYFIPDEPTCRSLNGKDDPEFVAAFRHLWLELLQQGLSVAAFTDDPNGGKPIIAGVNVLVLSLEGDELDYDQFKLSKQRKLIKGILELCDDAKIFEKYGIDRYMGALGLSVHPSYRGAALGGHLLRARENIGREYKIPATLTAFTSPISQKLAERCGFETLIERRYENVTDEKGNMLFPGVECDVLKIMAKRLY